VAALEPLRAPLGVHAVLGNHDWWSGEAPHIRRAFADARIHLLENNAVKIEHGRSGFWLAGLGDQLAYRNRGVQDLRGTLSHVKDRAPIILLAHEPDIFLHAPPRVTLTLAGHTHGGQVYIPFLGRPALMDNSLYSRLAYGHVVEHGRHIVVSSGLGLSNLPVRFMVPPEITVVTLSAPAEEARLRDLTA
jgi:predicted MPP superfamily phosphohydrolase